MRLSLFDWFGLLLGLFLCFWGVRRMQLAPHHLTVTLGGHVLADEWFTNNYTVTTGWRHEVTTNGYVLVPYPVTNELWYVWRIFR